MKKLLALALVMVLALFLLTACNGSGNDGGGNADGNLDGADWRAYRGYSYGKINEDISILYHYFDDQTIGFYLDQDYFDVLLCVDVSWSENPEACVNNLSFKDLDGDGFNDLRIPIPPYQDLLLLWNPEAWRYELMPGEEINWIFDGERSEYNEPANIGE